jgi:peptide-methionine (S)-S-oxide reductase
MQFRFGRRFASVAIIAAALFSADKLSAVQTNSAASSAGPETSQTPAESQEKKTMQAMFGGGCYWCVEAIFEELKGVESVESGFAGGAVDSPTYKQVSAGGTGHAEVVLVTYDPNAVSYEKLLEVFFKTHDPTTVNMQGPDVGAQYRSTILYFDEQQRETAERIKAALDKSGAFSSPIVTEIVPATKFFPADEDHQDYFQKNSRSSYCQFSIRPKLDKFRKVFADSLKTADK